LNKDKTLQIIGEINTGHFGDLDIARDAIRQAKAAGLDVIKFQSWKPQSIFTDSYLQENRIEAGLYKRFSLAKDQLRSLAEYCGEVGIGFSSTPYSESEIDELVEMPNLSFVKIASMEVNNLEFLKFAAKKNFPIVLSTGMSTFEEISRAIDVIRSISASSLTVLHCTSLYPTSPDQANLLNISLLKDSFPDLNIGFSDHTLGNEAGIAAVSLGARVLEKHFTTDKERIGFDNAMALSVQGISEYVESTRKSLSLLGSYSRTISPEESSQKGKMRRSLFLKEALDKGVVITSEMLVAQRPGDGISPDKKPQVVGRRTTHALEKDHKITESDFE
jgi:sialic acid synthase SpsE